MDPSGGSAASNVAAAPFETLPAPPDTISGVEKDGVAGAAIVGSGDDGGEGLLDLELEGLDTVDGHLGHAKVVVLAEPFSGKGDAMDNKAVGQEVEEGGGDASEQDAQARSDVHHLTGGSMMAEVIAGKGDAMGREVAQREGKGSWVASERDVQAKSGADKIATDGMAVEDDVAAEDTVSPPEEFPVSGDNVLDAEIKGDDAVCEVEKDSVAVNGSVLALEAVQSSKPEEQVPASSNGLSAADTDVFTDGGCKVRAKEDEASKGKGTVKQVTMKLNDSDMEDEQHARYLLPPEENKDLFGISDLVWGKVKSHPWWPGEIFDPFHASDMALKYQKEDKFLIAYFVDKTFAWNDESMLKPFYKHFLQMEKQSNHWAFVDAVDSALSEVARRIEVGMTCSCFADDDHAALKHKKIENAGIRKGTCSSSVDKSMVINSFEPDRILDFIKAVAQCPLGGADKQDLVIAKAQLKAFGCSKGYPDRSMLLSGGGLMETDSEISPFKKKDSEKDTIDQITSVAAGTSSGKRKRGRPSSKQKHISEDGRKRKRLSELVDEKEHLENGGQTRTRGKYVSGSSGKKPEIDTYMSPDSGKHREKRLDSLGDLDAKTPSPRSAKMGERMRRVASQMTGSPPILLSDGEMKGAPKMNRRISGALSVDGVTRANAEASGIKEGDLKASSPNEMLTQLFLVARDPLKGFSFLPDIISFFVDFRSSILSGLPEDIKHVDTSRGRKSRRKTVNAKPASVEMAAPDYIQDSYWADVVFCSSSEEEEQLLSSGCKKKGKSQSRGRKKKMKHADEGPSLSLPSDSVVGAAEDLKGCVVYPLMEQEFTEGNPLCNLGEKLAEGYLKLDAVTDVQVGLADPCTKQESAEGRMVNDSEETFADKKVVSNAKPDLQKRSSDPCTQKLTERRPLNEIAGTVTEEFSPTALILSFTESDTLPSEIDLVEIFSRFGPLEEAETEVVKESSRAKVVFKRRTDAEMAFNSAGKYSLFGPALVSYRLRYQASTPKASHDTKQENKDALHSGGGDLKLPDAGGNV